MNTIKGTSIISNKILTIDTGEEVGKVHDIIYDPQLNKVRAILVDEGGIFSSAKVILLENVHSIGEDAILIPTKTAINKVSDIQEKVSHIAKENNYLTKTKVVTEDGKDLGIIDDIFFTAATGYVTSFEVTGSIIDKVKKGKTVIDVNDIITIGQNATIVKKYVESKMEEQGNHQGIQGAMESLKDNISNTASNIHSDVKNTYSKAQEKTQDPKTQDKVKRTYEDIKNNTINGFKDLTDNVKDVFIKAKDTTLERKEDLQNSQTEGQEKNALGQYLNRNVLSMDNEIIGKKGDMVTSDMINKAKTKGMLDIVLSSLSISRPQLI